MRCDGLLAEIRNIIVELTDFNFIGNSRATLLGNQLASQDVHCLCQVIDAYLLAILVQHASFHLLLL